MFSVNFSVLEMVCSFHAEKERNTTLTRKRPEKECALCELANPAIASVDVEAGNALTRNYNVRKLIL